MKHSSKAQASTEYIMIFGIALVLIAITGAVFFSYVNESKTTLDQKQIEKMGNEIMDNVDKIYFLGQGNRVTLKMTFPDNLVNFTIQHTQNAGEPFEYLNITYFWQGQKTSSIFNPSDLYVRFNCTYCYHVRTLGSKMNVSYYNASDASLGTKQIQITSMGSFVNVDFVR